MKLDDGRLEVKPVRLDIPRGVLNMSMSLEPTAEKMIAQVAMDIDHFDYGVLARRQKPDSDMGGHISVDAALDFRSDDPEKLLGNANGDVLFGIWPENIEADVFDLWTVNLLVAIMPSERVQRQIDRFLDQAEEAATSEDWARVREMCQRALALDAENADARAFLEMSADELGSMPEGEAVTLGPGREAADVLAALPLPDSFLKLVPDRNGYMAWIRGATTSPGYWTGGAALSGLADHEGYVSTGITVRMADTVRPFRGLVPA